MNLKSNRLVAVLLMAVMLIGYVPASQADATVLNLPSSLKTIEEEAFEGSAASTVVIPDSVTQIEKHAFANCPNLTDVYIPGGDIWIDSNAFEGSTHVKLHVVYGTPAYTFALAKGIDYIAEEQGSFIDAVTALVRDKGMPSHSALQSSTFAAQRLLVISNNGKLPDITAYNPDQIFTDNSGYFVIQFSSTEETKDCNNYLNSCGLLVEADTIVGTNATADDEIISAALDNWTNNDPMGMKAYSDYVKAHSSGSVTVAVIDSGVGEAPSLSGHVRSDGADFISVGDRNPRYDSTGHGTNVASLIIDATYGANVQILPIRVFSANEDDTMLSMLINAVDFAKRKKVNVVNMSFKVDHSQVLERKIAALGMPVVVAAGNNNTNTSNVFPAMMSSVITVSAIDSSLERWSLSNYGSSVDYCAPGVNVNTSYSSSLSGTSFAAPHISAAFALLALDPNHGRGDMDKYVTDLGAKGKDSQYGLGLPNMAMLTDRVQQITYTDVDSHVIKRGDSVTVHYGILPDEAQNKTVTLETSNPSVLTAELVSEGTIKLTAKAKGKSTLTIISNDNTKVTYTTTEYQVVVPVTSITITPPKTEVNKYNNETLGFYTVIEPSDADNKDIKWSSGDTNIATVASNGIVSPASVGKTTIKAEAADGFGATATCVISVVYRAEPTDIQIDASANPIKPNETSQLTATVYPDGTDSRILWSSLNSDIATVDRNTGLVKAIKSGTAIIEAISLADPNVSGKYELKVIVEPTGISISGPDSINVSQSASYTATVSPSNVDNNKVTWSITTGEAYATVDSAGKVNVTSAPSSGTTNIVVRATSVAKSSIYAQKTITIYQQPAQITISGPQSVYTNDKITLSATVKPDNAYNKEVTWSSGNTAIATVASNGVVTGVAEGVVTITAKSSVNSNISASYSINVYPQWTSWSDWSTTSYTASSTMQVENKTQYRYRDQTQAEAYGAWSAWSAWDISSQTVSDANIKEEQTGTIYPWYYFKCKNCGAHMKFSNSKCSSCNKTAGGTWVGPVYTTKAWSISNPTDSNKVSYTETEYGYGVLWSYSTSRPSNVPAKATGYRYRTRTYTAQAWGNWSGWSDTKATSSTTRQVETRTVYRYRTKYDPKKSISGWVLSSQVPSGANVVARKYTYTETTTSTSSSLDGWTQTGSNWITTGSGSVDWVNFSVIPGYKKDNEFYTKYNVAAPTANTGTGTRRTVSTSTTSYLYWHWMYSCSSGAGNRAIFYQNGYGSSKLTGNDYYYKNFGAFVSSTAYPAISSDGSGNWGQDDKYYLWYKVSDRTSNAQSQASYYWYKTPINRTTYTDQTLYYTYSRSNESSTKPTGNVTNLQEYVMYEITK